MFNMAKPPACNGDSCPLRRLPVFQGVALDIWRRFAACVSVNTYQQDDILFYEGNRPLGVYFSCHGRIKIVKNHHSGRSQIVRIVEGPELIGDRAFFSQKPYAASGVVMDDSTICFLDSRRFWELFGASKDTGRLLARRFANELGQAEERLHCLAVCPVKGRIAANLLGRCGAPRAESREFILKESRTELAQLLGTTIEAVSRTLAEFRRKGLIDVAGRRISVKNEERLRRVGCGSCPPAESTRP